MQLDCTQSSQSPSRIGKLSVYHASCRFEPISIHHQGRTLMLQTVLLVQRQDTQTSSRLSLDSYFTHAGDLEPAASITHNVDWSGMPERFFPLELAGSSDFRQIDEINGQRRPAHVVVPPTLFNPFKDPRLRARPCDRLRMRTKPVIGPSSPSFSMLRFASASSPVREN